MSTALWLYYNDGMFYFDEINNKKILKSDLIENALFTTRETCIKSKDENLIPFTLQNREELKNYLKIQKLIYPNQTHSANIETADFYKDFYKETDALILTDKRLGIFLNFADCTPIVLFDKTQNIGAIAHAGWRGTVAKIGPKTALKMREDYGCKIEDISALIGPCISKCCFEVGFEVYEKLCESVNTPPAYPKSEKVFADLKEINRIQLEQVGIKNIDICPYCTVCDNDKFFSYRKENGTHNRHSAVLWLN